MLELTPDIVLKAYCAGIFPMSEGRDDPEIFWVDPPSRGVLPLDDFHVPRRLARTIRANPFQIRIDSAFSRVINACAQESQSRDGTWINGEITELYCELHDMGYAHSVECWQTDETGEDQLVGALYGVAIAGAFFGESMFSTVRDASKVALIHLAALLKSGGYRLLDAQFVTDHLTQFGALEIPRDDYHLLLERALGEPAEFSKTPLQFPLEVLSSKGATSGGDSLTRQSITQTS